ncbi:uncharacterized protein LOC131938981 isoform X2 [Physella acuta]|uniref:uncharacterized protein LOC131938981 isoform X2 n=1 Tax=Physella acuta TaxID=109671 RepID=UPI0027DB4B54|nr:uncharacterized protein LOC131938981 isoform X2 [Physella acuta]
MASSLVVVLVLSFVVGAVSQVTDTTSHCSYLLLSKSQFQENAAPFKLYTRSKQPRITSGEPVEVTIGPFSQHLNFFNFTDFILYASPANTANLELEYFPGGPNPHLGVFQLFDQWRAGAGGMSCNARSRTEDSVGAFEERLLNIFKRYYPNNPMLMRYQPPARNQVSVLWWPTKEALAYPEIKFIANLKSMNNWFKIESTIWKVNRPVDHWAMTERMLTQYQAIQNNMRAMERRLDQPV